MAKEISKIFNKNGKKFQKTDKINAKKFHVQKNLKK